MKLKDFIQLFLDGNDDKVHIDLYVYSDAILVFSDIRIINGLLKKYYERKVIGLFECERLSVIVDREV